MSAHEIAACSTILLSTVGSTVHGLNLPGTDDRDLMGVCVEPAEYVVGLRHFEQLVYRTQPEGVRSGHGDTDLTVYSLRKWARLACGGNPTILLLLFVPDDACAILTPQGAALRSLAPAFLSHHAIRAYLGYMVQQRQRLTGELGQKDCKRPELVAAHGFDTKYAGHVLRLGVQGTELARIGRITLPMPEPERARILAVRRGEVPLQDVLTEAGQLERELKDYLDASALPDEPDYDAVNRFLVETYRARWGHPDPVPYDWRAIIGRAL